MIEKIRLNDKQWAVLVGLTSGSMHEPGIELTQLSARLVSHGLVSQTANGHLYLTERGKLRVEQGR
jgi:hypothetical protein